MAAMHSHNSTRIASDGATGVGERDPAISDSMSASEILAHLGRHGCSDITYQFDLAKTERSPISTGGFGDVYRGKLHNGDRVAVKSLRMLVSADDSGEKRLKHAAHELYVWSKCRHPNILELIGVAKFDNQIAMVSPWMGNGNLSWYLSQHPETDRYRLSSQIADAVAYLRSCNMVHGDIKGANILVSDEHIPKLADFGNSVLGEYTLTFTTTTTRPHMTVRWTAPENFLEETKHTFEGDVYALGMTILEIFTGSAPYEGLLDVAYFRSAPYEGLLDVAVMRRLMLREQPERPQQHMPTGDELSDHLWDLLTSCWDSEPKKRPFAAVVRNKLKVMKKKRMPGVYCPRMSFSTHFTRVGLRYSTRPNEHFAVLLPKSLWKPDEMADGCDTLTCDAKFSLFERRHVWRCLLSGLFLSSDVTP
ncbi:unnamed protein product [Rhizoctonia solani]|uniref:Protein kinase domain-containing protein n=1 Tax=Rhizoctonia solani TaxID=456999 RepID=A0A8H3HL94_9AGAM|nr:unnamed protein product [Rhizoctonia solani]